MTEVNDTNREDMISEYIECILEGMDGRSRDELLYDYMSNDISSLSNEDLTKDIRENMPHLLE